MRDFHGFYFQTKVVLVDDNQQFLDNLGIKLSEKYIIETYNTPAVAVKAIHENIQNSPLHNNFPLMTQVEDEELGENYYEINFSKLHELTNNQTKSNTISVVIADYSMPILNGIEFCAQISTLPILKIMLTGHTDYKLAVDALNKRIIDKFIIKDSASMLNDLIHLIDIYQKEFFLKCSSSLLPCLSSISNKLINSNEYQKIFQQVIDNLCIAEYYLLNSTGTYLLIAKNGARYYFSCFNDDTLMQYLDIAQNAKADMSLISKIKDKTHAPLLIREEHYKIPVNNWNTLLHPLICHGSEYYCVVSESEHRNPSYSS